MEKGELVDQRIADLERQLAKICAKVDGQEEAIDEINHQVEESRFNSEVALAHSGRYRSDDYFLNL